MAINFTGGQSAYNTMIDNFSKTIGMQIATKTVDNVTGQETLTYGSSSNITGAFFRKLDEWSQGKEGLFQGCEAILMVKTSVSLLKDNLLTYDGQDFIIHDVKPRGYNGSVFYYVARCNLV